MYTAADGSKVRKVFGGKTTDYLDGFQYENGVLQFVPTSEGYYDLTKISIFTITQITLEM